jgi:5-methylcytosine-specific restriction endonuclease McrA
MGIDKFEEKDFWRAIILYGLNQATYKIALGQCLIDFAKQGKTNVKMSELAVSFFDLYHDRLKNGKPQLVMPNRRTVMEKIVDLYNLGKLNRTAAIERVQREAFNDVVPRFHTVNNMELPMTFYEHSPKGLVIKDNLFEVFAENKNADLEQELGSRWDLLESAFEMRREDSELANDIRRFYLEKGYNRTSITHTIPVLNGYQNGVCFYCGEQMHDDIHVDHVIPRQFIHHDEVWNLVLAHGFCNELKSDWLPGVQYIEKLIARNEHFIASNHPIQKRLISKLGTSAKQRRKYIYEVYDDAKVVLGNIPWTGVRGYNPEMDSFYVSV